ncbi:MAG: peptidoglycan-binding protein [Lachnospiraceae bacterium]|nr:peptidoglycan-binding protein [Lachnospiraceae bacterium]
MSASNAGDRGVILTLSSSSVLQKGSRGDEVKVLQQNLTTLGYDTKGTDGIFGNDTEAAVIAFQKAYSLTADGKAGPATQSAIAKALDYHNKGILTVGSRGAKVSELQRNLTKLGYDTKGTDGIFGSNTKSAVIAFQRDHGLSQDGMAGKDTLNAINQAIESLGTGQTPPSDNPTNIQKMLDNIKNDTSLGLSADKKTAMYMAAERLLNDGYEVEFVAGILGNIQNEGTPGKFESSAYSNPDKKPAYLKYMDEHFDYRNKFSGKSITEVGISAAIQLQNGAAASGYAGKFGLGIMPEFIQIGKQAI